MNKQFKKLLTLTIMTIIIFSTMILPNTATSAEYIGVTVYDRKDQNMPPQESNAACGFGEGKYTNSFDWNARNNHWIYNGYGGKIRNDTISSIWVREGTRVILTDDTNYRDTAVTYVGPSIINLMNLDNKVSSIIVERLSLTPKLPTVYEDEAFGKKSQTLKVGDYRKRDLTMGNDKISSIKVPDGYTVKLWDDDKYKDRSIIVKGPAFLPYLNNFNDKTSSLKVRSGYWNDIP